ncbi:ADP-ribosylglycohydrolase family protein [Sphingomonas sp. Tas61C01]|uniref:ADP-ribosylglycohydrolase family protein n=1 Tax=Sphingomonas sp. Tas61C01 TaxID=3458297 RepID=UPI00403EB1CE
MTSKPRTSASHPLQIAAVPAGTGIGRIGVTFCPGKKQTSAMTGIWDRCLDTDVAAIAAWGAVLVISLVEDHELASLQVNGLGQAVRHAHMDWLHLPIRDVSVPSIAFEKSWREVGPGIRSRLRAGFDVVVHCKGGLGRAGLVACRMLIDCGMAPEQALAAVRQARTGAVETSSQAEYVLGLKPLAEVAPATGSTAVEDRAVGALLGLAVGDAVGTTLEFTRRGAQPLLTDMVGGGPFKLKPGEWTDDTAMALALADSLATDPSLDERDLMARFVDWQRSGTYSCTGRCFDIGVTTSQALARFRSSGDPAAGSTDPMSAGNGSLMRLSPVAICHWRDGKALASIAARQSVTTHAAAEAVSACVGFAAILADAIAGEPRDMVLGPRTIELAPAVRSVLAGSWRGKQRDQIRSSGYVIHSLEAALWCVACTSDFASAVLLAANLADDADTTAAITGQLAGALYGMSGIPTAWLDKLAWRERLTTAARALLA